MLLTKKIFEFHAQVQKCHFGKIEKLAKWHFLTKSISLKHYKMAIRKNIHDFSQDLPNQGFMQKKVQKGDFLKKNSRELKFFFLF